MRELDDTEKQYIIEETKRYYKKRGLDLDSIEILPVDDDFVDVKVSFSTSSIKRMRRISTELTSCSAISWAKNI